MICYRKTERVKKRGKATDVLALVRYHTHPNEGYGRNLRDGGTNIMDQRKILADNWIESSLKVVRD